jgi:hypothetical protein
MQPPRPKRKDNIPSLEMSLTAKTGDEFENLEGNEEDKKVDRLVEWPKCFLAHPNISNQLNSQRQVRASVAGVILVEAIIATNRNVSKQMTMDKSVDLTSLTSNGAKIRLI